MSDTLVTFTLTAACPPLIVAYACRFKGISWFTTRIEVVGFNAAMLQFCGSVLYRSAVGESSGFDAFGLIAAALWLRVSWATWGHGTVPAHVITRPAALQAEPIRIDDARAPRARRARRARGGK